MMLLFVAVRTLPSRKPEGVVIDVSRRNLILAWITTLVHKVGVTVPF
jgi:hypothetical protein